MDDLLPFEEYDKFSEAAKTAYMRDLMCGLLIELAKPMLNAPPVAKIRVKDILDKDSGNPTIVFGITEDGLVTS